MKLIKILYLGVSLLVGLFFISSSPVSAAPAPEYFVINETERQCGIYWAGDEFSYHALPSGWKIYEPETNLVLETPFGVCDFVYSGQNDKADRDKYYGQCCTKLGFKYKADTYYNNYYENPGVYNKNLIKYDGRDWSCVSENNGFSTSHIDILINKKTNECGAFPGFTLRGVDYGLRIPTKEECYFTDKNFTVYETPINDKTFKSKIITPFGECNNPGDIDSCCKQLGLKNVGKNLGEPLVPDLKKPNTLNNIASIVILLMVSLFILILGILLFKKYNKPKIS